MASKPKRATGAMVALAVVIATPLVMSFEGKANITYLDVAAIPTYCFGHADRTAVVGSWRSDAECRAVLDADMRKHADGIAACLHVLLPAEMLAAAITLGFNIGVAALWDPLESTCRHASLSIL